MKNTRRNLLTVFLLALLALGGYAYSQSINSATVGNANFNSSTPAAPAGSLLVTFQNAGVNVSAYTTPSQGTVNLIAYSTTPTLNPTLGSIQQFACTTAGAAISPTLTGLKAGQSFSLIFVQNGTTACTLTYPSNMHGGTTVGTTLSGVNIQTFKVSNNGTDAYAAGAASTNMTGGTP